MSSSNNNQGNDNQGEGNRDAARNYNEDKQDFIESGGVEENAQKHKNLSDAEKAELEKAHEKAKDKAKS